MFKNKQYILINLNQNEVINVVGSGLTGPECYCVSRSAMPGREKYMPEHWEKISFLTEQVCAALCCRNAGVYGYVWQEGCIYVGGFPRPCSSVVVSTLLGGYYV
jgi:hypothetical protein